MKRKNGMMGLLIGGMMLGAWSCGNADKPSNETGTAPQGVNEKKALVQVEGRKNFGAKGIIAPLPTIMIATYDADGVADVMMAAWGGQCGPNEICFFLSPHKTTENIALKKACTIGFASQKTLAQSDYFGIVSGHDVADKVSRAGFTAQKSPNVDAPIIKEYPLTLECEVIEMEKTQVGNTRVVCEIVNMSAEAEVLDDEGNVDLGKLGLVIYDSASHQYRAVGDSVGTAWVSGRIFE